MYHYKKSGGRVKEEYRRWGEVEEVQRGELGFGIVFSDHVVPIYTRVSNPNPLRM